MTSSGLGPTSIVFIVFLDVFEEDVLQGHTNIHGQYFDADLATLGGGGGGGGGGTLLSVSISGHSRLALQV